MHDGCGICGIGRRLAEVTFDLDSGQVRWTMWSCGHAARVVIEPHAAELVAATN